MKSYIEQCKLARCSQQNFKQFLINLQNEYEKIWDENLKLVKMIEDYKIENCQCANNNLSQEKKINPLAVISDINKENNPLGIKGSPKNVSSSSKHLHSSIISAEYVPEIMSIDFNSDSEPTQNRAKVENKEITSPIISKRRRRRRKQRINKSLFEYTSECCELSQNNDFPDEELEQAMCQVSTEVTDSESFSKTFENQLIKDISGSLINDSDDFQSINIENIDGSDDVKINEKPNVSCKLFINKSGSGDTEMLQNGRKLIQSKLVLQTVKQKPETLFSLEDENIKTNWNAIIPKNEESDVTGTSNCENMKQESDNEVIPLSPLRSFKPKSKLSLSIRTSGNDSKKNLLETISQNELLNDTKDETYFVLPNPSQIPGTSNQRAKRKLEKNEVFDDSSINDETFFSPSERDRMKQSKLEEEMNVPNDNTKSVIKGLDFKKPEEMIKMDMPFIGKTVRGKMERARLEGWDCWECEKFYEGAGFTEEEKKKLKKKCSRHRSKYNERFNTPAGFWNPVFSNPRTQSDDQ